VAEFLIKVGKASGRKDYLEMAQKALTYTLKQQNEDGSFCYWERIRKRSARSTTTMPVSKFALFTRYGNRPEKKESMEHLGSVITSIVKIYLHLKDIPR